jgi:hypothetical protein
VAVLHPVTVRRPDGAVPFAVSTLVAAVAGGSAGDAETRGAVKSKE